MNIHSERVEQIRSLMEKDNIGLYLIPMDDCHGSEYVADHFRCIEYVSGFTGSAGTLIISMDGAWLYADGRYYVQAAAQLAGSCIELMKLAAPDVPDPEDFIAQKMQDILAADETLAFGFDGCVVNVRSRNRYLEKIAAKCHLETDKIPVRTDRDLVGEIWTDRPAQRFSDIWILDEQYTGQSAAEKLSRIREKLTEYTGTADNYLYLISSLDDLAWIFNIRGDDLPETPAVFAYAAICPDKAVLFVGDGAADEKVKAHLLSQGVQLGEYSGRCLCLPVEDGMQVLADLSKTNVAVYDHYIGCGCKVKDIAHPSQIFKAVKNDTELRRAKNALLRDSAYVTAFMKWLKEKAEAAGAGNAMTNDDGSAMSELSVDEKLDEFRTEDSLYIGKSFATIAAYKDNAAMMHYQAKPDNFRYISAEGMLLIDSGVQFRDGTTDITRTFILGPVTDEEKKAFTLTAVSMLRLMNARFIDGCCGENLDIIAREPMWEQGWDYKCGTGHGVGHVLNVHEGPHSIRWKISDNVSHTPLKEGMIVTDEPGVYREGQFGIRTENEIFVKAFMETPDGKFMCFEPMTFIPIDLDGIDTAYMSEQDINLLNEYHRQVREKLSSLLDQDTLRWLDVYTREIHK